MPIGQMLLDERSAEIFLRVVTADLARDTRGMLSERGRAGVGHAGCVSISAGRPTV